MQEAAIESDVSLSLCLRGARRDRQLRLLSCSTTRLPVRQKSAFVADYANLRFQLLRSAEGPITTVALPPVELIKRLAI